MGLIEGRSPHQIKERFEDLYLTLLLANWKVWPLAQVFFFFKIAFGDTATHN